MNTSLKALLGILLLVGTLSAQDAARGHWKGAISIPDRELEVQIDLDKTAQGWIGSISVPAQNSSGMQLESITFSNGKLSFRIKGIPGEPRFSSTMSADGTTMTGEFTHGPTSAPFKATRTGDPNVELPKSSPAVAKGFLGKWEGTLEAGQPLRLILTISNGDSGAAATLVSVDQGGNEIPVQSIEQKDLKITLKVAAIGGEFQADINKEATELTGTWTQGGNSLPLTMKKAPKP